MDRITWQELKDYCNKLDESTLSMNVYAFINDNETGTPIREISEVEDDVYFHIDDHEDRGTLKELKDLYGDDFDENEFELATKKGYPFLWIDEYLD